MIPAVEHLAYLSAAATVEEVLPNCFNGKSGACYTLKKARGKCLLSLETFSSFIGNPNPPDFCFPFGESAWFLLLIYMETRLFLFPSTFSTR